MTRINEKSLKKIATGARILAEGRFIGIIYFLVLSQRNPQNSKFHVLNNQKRYSMLLATTTYKLQIIQCGGQLQDVREFWKEAMKIEEELTATNQMH